jgi:hypothetical protein
LSKIEVDTVEPQSGTSLTLGASGDTITIPAGATIDASGATVTLPTTIEVDAVEPQSGTTLTLGASGDTVSVPTGATLDVTNATVTGLPASGKVLQVVTATDDTNRTTTSTSFVTGSNTLSLSITPSSASNKIFVIASSTVVNGSGDGYVFSTIYRDSTNLGNVTYGMGVVNSVSGVTAIRAPLCMTILDSPSSTSALTYQVYFRSNNVSYTASLGGGNEVVKGSITAWEISA